MRLPRRIFLNVVIFISSFLVVSYHKTAQCTCRALQPELLLSYCSTPPLKRKIKFSLQTVPFVPTPAAFFPAAGGVVIRRTFSAGAGRRGLESAAQFSTGCIVIGGTVCRAASFIQVVILHTIPGSRRWKHPHSLRWGCYRQHNFGTVCIAGQKKWLLSGAQFGLFSEGGRLLSTAQFARWVKFGYCYRQHISEFRLLSNRVRTGLLSSAHFRQWGCYRAHSFQTVEFWRLLLSTAHF